MSSFTYVVRTPDGVTAQGTCDAMVVPTTRGKTGILASHAPLIATVAEGQLDIRLEGRELAVTVGPGLVEVLNDTVALFVERAGSP